MNNLTQDNLTQDNLTQDNLTQDNCKQILTNDEVVIKFTNENDNSKIKLDYHVYINTRTESIIDYNSLLAFINKNYLVNPTNSIVYNIDLLKFYCKEALVIEFYPKGKKTIVGYIFGRKHKISYVNFNNKKIHNLNIDDSNMVDSSIADAIEANFLCIVPSLRNLNIASFMINTLKIEMIKIYNIGIAHYTVDLSRDIHIPYFSQKNFFHRLININELKKCGFINSNIDVKKYKEKYNNFLNNNIYHVEYFNNIHNNMSQVSYDINILYNKMMEYNIKNYDIFEYISYDIFCDNFNNSIFHHFIIKNKENEIINYVCMFKLDNINSMNKSTYKNGMVYNMFFNMGDIINSMEIIHKYIYDNNIFDVITMMDIYNKCDHKEYELMNYSRGSGNLGYYFFNIYNTMIENSRNSIVTI